MLKILKEEAQQIIKQNFLSVIILNKIRIKNNKIGKNLIH